MKEPRSGMTKKLSVDPKDKKQHLLSVLRENELLKKRIADNTEPFYSQAHLFKSLLTLNEIHFLQSFVESAAHLLNAHRVSLYQYQSKERGFKKFSTYDKAEGLTIEQDILQNDQIFRLIKESKSLLSIREVLYNEKLYKIWKSSRSRALIYCPIHLDQQLWGILTIDEIKFHHLHIETVRNANAITKLAALALKNIKIHQQITKKGRAQSKLLTDYQQFLKSLNSEFRKSFRFKFPLSLILVALEPQNKAHIHNYNGISLIDKIRKCCEKNLREVDMLYDDKTIGRFWIILPMTNFSGLAFVLERLHLIINMELARQSDYTYHFGFCSIDDSIKLPKQMIETCNESYQLHHMVRAMLNEKRGNPKNS